MPNIWNKKFPEIDNRRKSQSATLSPVQWPANLPVPTELLLEMMKGLPCFYKKLKVGIVEKCP